MVLDDFFKAVAQQYKNKLPFVIYRKPNTLDVKGMLQKDTALHITEDFKASGFVFAPFDDKFPAIILPVQYSKQILTTYKQSNLNTSYSSKTFNTYDIEKNFHINLVKKGINLIKKGELQKVVLSRKETVAFQNEDIFSIFQKLLATYTSAFVYCWYHPEIGLWLGATPETLLKIEDRNFSIMALAGTQNYNGTLNVVWQNKEIKEQQFVTDFILSNIKSRVENIKVSNVETVKAGNLLHLRTLIKGRLSSQNFNLKKLLYDLHPTPAVCGLPKALAKTFILENENYNRTFYTGFLGELNIEATVTPRTGKRNIENRAYALKRKSTQLYVNLRCMEINGNEAFIYVGGGITDTSNPESEWEETVSKSMVVKKVL
jgi:isochorismate synthase